MKLRLLFLLFVLVTSGCATVTSGTSQPFTVETDPKGATCRLFRDDKTVGYVNPTPGTLTVDKSMSALGVECKKEGYKPTYMGVEAKHNPASFGNILLGGVVGIVIDAASGAAAYYEPSVFITLDPIETGAVDKAIEELKGR